MKDLSHAAKDLESKLTAALNQFSADIISKEGLAQRGPSPVRTGFYASSWQTSRARIQPADKIEDFAPWSELAKRYSEEGVVSPVIKPRFTALSDLKLRDAVYVGNSVEYAESAVESRNSGLIPYIQGQGIKGLLQKNFSEKGVKS